MINFKVRGDWKKTEDFLKKASKSSSFFDQLAVFGQEGVTALSAATPKDTGKTAASWSYKINKTQDAVSLTWYNSSVADGSSIPIVILIQYGHGTGSGAYVQGTDFINPVMKPIFDKINDYVWKEVRS